MDSCVWIPALGFLDLDFWVWIPAFGFLGGLDSWVWSPGLGFLGLDPWLWSPELGVVCLDSWILSPGQKLAENPIATISLLTKLANHEQVLTTDCPRPGELGRKHYFFLQALHKLARALQITLTW